MTIKEFEKEQAKLLKNAEVREAWLEYLSRFPHVSLYYRNARQYENQISVVNGKKAGTDINLYKLFTEQCYNLLRPGGACGIVIPSGIYTDLGAKQLRELLFSRARINRLFGLSNERFLFEGVDHRFKICLLTFEKGGATERFDAAFRINPREAVRQEELDYFLNTPDNWVNISVDFIRRQSPESLSVMEIREAVDFRIAEKMLRIPALGEDIDGSFSFKLTREFDMTNDSHLFKTEHGKGRLPLYEGKMIHQFVHDFATPRYWVEEAEGRSSVLKKESDSGQMLDYQEFRLGLRAIARSTDERTIICGPVPPNVYCGISVLVSKESKQFSSLDKLYVMAILNSFCADYYARGMVSANINMFYINQIPVPRLSPESQLYRPIVTRAARLICTAPEFAALWQEVMGTAWAPASGATDEADRLRLRSELDG
ncbi:MAG: hypothetical protein JNK89_02530, partial [Saprospiraceae bacterium]|nr:hypothetical protein [Saprospiraceae bacterium]